MRRMGKKESRLSFHPHLSKKERIYIEAEMLYKEKSFIHTGTRELCVNRSTMWWWRLIRPRFMGKGGERGGRGEEILNSNNPRISSRLLLKLIKFQKKNERTQKKSSKKLKSAFFFHSASYVSISPAASPCKLIYKWK